MSEALDTAADASSAAQKWGRVLICGGTNWAMNGKKERPADTSSDLLNPHILRSLCHIKVVKLITGPAANYAVALDIHGIAHLFGRLPSAAFSPKTGGVVSELKPFKLSPRTVGLGKGVKWVGGAAARSHLLLVADDGSVWGIGNNVFGQIGLSPQQEVETFTKIAGPWSKEPGSRVVQVTAGHTFSLFLTSTGQIYAAGSSESGQLGNGKTGERILKGGKVGFDIECPARLVNGLSGKKIVQIASGNQHSLALDDEGYVYAWGFAGYARLGLQDQKDRLVPTIVPTFIGRNDLNRGADVVCGPTNSVVVDRNGMYHMAGKWKNTGDGSHGAPYTTFKVIQEIMGCKVQKASCGGCTHFLTTPDPEGGTMTVGFGQGCLYGELGLGVESGKSSTKPVKLEPLSGVDIIDVSAGSFCTLFLARPSAEMSEVPRWPVHIRTPDICIVCKKKEGDPLECERCDMPYHLHCLNPPLETVPDGEWFCPKCEAEMQITPEEEEEMARENAARPKAKKPRTSMAPPPGPVNGNTRGQSGTPASRAKSGTPAGIDKGGDSVSDRDRGKRTPSRTPVSQGQAGTSRSPAASKRKASGSVEE